MSGNSPIRVIINERKSDVPTRQLSSYQGNSILPENYFKVYKVSNSPQMKKLVKIVNSKGALVNMPRRVLPRKYFSPSSKLVLPLSINAVKPVCHKMKSQQFVSGKLSVNKSIVEIESTSQISPRENSTRQNSLVSSKSISLESKNVVKKKSILPEVKVY